MESIYLSGSEDVRSAASRMHEAAAEMSRAAMNYQYATEQHQRFLDDWLMRFADTVATLSTAVRETGTTTAG